MITTRTDADGTSVITVDGELDLLNAPELQRTVQRVLDKKEGLGRLVFELAGLSFIDSAGISVLVNATTRGTSVEIHTPTPIVRRVIEVTGLLSILTIVPAGA